MSRYRHPLYLCFVLCLLLCLPACAMKQSPKAKAAPSLIDRSLLEASQAISRDLNILTGSQISLGARPAHATGPLWEPMDLVYEGPLPHALERVCAHIGYRLIVFGKEPELVPLIHVRVQAKPALRALREIGLQTGAGELIRVNEPSKTIELHWLTKDNRHPLLRAESTRR